MTESLNLVTATIEDLQEALQAGRLTSEQLIGQYLDSIEANNEHGYCLRAIIEVAPTELLLGIARQCDRERSAGRSRGHLHGIPIAVKDSIDVHPAMGMSTTSGTIALVESRPKESAMVIQRLVNAGAIVLGKANMDVFSHFLDPLQPAGWSPRGGQCVSAFGDGQKVSGSSSGSAVAVSAGFCAASLGVEQCGSVNQPAHCAGLYGLKPTPGLVPRNGVLMIRHPTRKCRTNRKVAMGSGCLAFRPGGHGLWFRVGIIGDDIDCTRGINPKDTNLRLECRKAYEALVSILKPAVAINPVDCDALFSFVQEEDNFGWDENGQWAGLREDLAVMYEMADNVDTYLGQREDCALETLEDLAKWNDDHSSTIHNLISQTEAFHPSRIDSPDRQIWLQGAARLRRADRRQYHDILSEAKRALDETINYMGRHKLDLLVVKAGTCKEWYPCIGAITRLPVATMPVGQLSDGSNLAVYLIALPKEEKTLLSFMSAAEKVIPRRPIPQRMFNLQSSVMGPVADHAE